MAKVKLTKTELKAQKDALARYRRFLPMLQLKKSQLQMELGGMRAREADLARREEELLDGVKPWIGLLADAGVEVPVALERVRTRAGNIAGVAVRSLKTLKFKRGAVDLWATPAWLDSGLATLEQLFRLRVERRLLEETHRLLAEELRTTSQRVNLFEKVKIPECRENIRVINIFLGDENTSAVVRSKIAKGKSVQKAQAAEAEAAGEVVA